MSLRQSGKILSAASFRLTIAYAGVFLAGLLAILVVGGIGTMVVLEADLRSAVDVEIEELEAIFAERGLADVIAEITSRSDTIDRDVLYQLQTFDGRVLAGFPPLVEVEEDWFSFLPPGGEEDEPFNARATALEDGLWLVVAESAEVLDDTEEIVVSGAIWVFAVSFPLAALCGWMMAVMVLRRIDNITQATNRIRDGGLTTRVPVGSAGDEFDRLAASINAMLDSIEALTRNIQEVSIGIAHELKTPLTHIRNKLVSLRAVDVSSDELTAKIDGTIGEMDSVLGTFDALLRISQIDAGSRRADFQRIDLSAIVNDLAETYEPVASETGKTLNAEIAPDVETRGDRSLLTQMIANAVENAIEHTPAQATISLDLSRRDHGPILVVADNGPGIPEHERERVFERFYRLDRSRHLGGNGLGLTIVASIAKIHGIQIRLRDNGPGLRFEFAFEA